MLTLEEKQILSYLDSKCEYVSLDKLKKDLIYVDENALKNIIDKGLVDKDPFEKYMINRKGELALSEYIRISR